MDVRSRTPEGVPSGCPACGKSIVLTPSEPAGDAPCPHCGALLWFIRIDDGYWYCQKSDLRGRPVPLQPDGNVSLLNNPGTGPYFREGDIVRIKTGTFEQFEGKVASADYATGKVSVTVSVFGRDVPIELDKRQLEFG